MSKEFVISITPQETKAAILENDQVIEIHVERDKEQHGLVGSIFRGKVTKVLPGMQSAFVDIGLERDSFLYVSDFFEDTEEYDKIVSTAEEQVARMEAVTKEVTVLPPAEGAHAPESGLPATNTLKYQDRQGRSRRSRRGRLRGKRFDDATPPQIQPVEAVPEKPRGVEETPAEAAGEIPTILPGESLAKYRNLNLSTSSTDPADGIAPARSTHVGGPAPELKIEAEDEETEALDLVEDLEEEREPEEEVLAEPQIASLVVPELASETPVTAQDSSHSADKPFVAQGFSEPRRGESPSVSAVTEESTIPAKPPATPPALSAEIQLTSKAVSLNSDDDHKVETTPAVQATPITPQMETPPVQEASPSSQPSGPVLSQSQKTETGPAGVTPSSQAQYRNIPNAPRFFRKNLDRRRRPHLAPEDRKEGGASSEYPLIADLLKEGQEILVQISKEPLGTKGARITSHIALPGRYLVYMPTVNHIGVSRKIDSDEERQRLKRIILENRGALPGGFIVRTAGEGKGEDEFKSDIRFLSTLWAEIKSKSERRGAPALIHRDLNLVQRLLRDQLSTDFSAIRIDNETKYASILEFVNRFQPSLVNRIKLYTKETPIFEEFGVQEEIERALRPKVWLKSGGYIVIDQAEALLAIDVNTGKYVGKSNKLEDTIFKTNIEAAKEIARQIRLRDLGGIIVCDFIDMEDRKNRQKVTQTLEEALRTDKSPSKILQFNDFGLVAITRKRVKQSLMKIYCEPCTYCNGSGMVKSPQTICYEIQAEAKKMAKALEENKEVTLRVNPEVARVLKTEEASVITEIETFLKKEVLVKSDPLLHQEHFDIF